MSLLAWYLRRKKFNIPQQSFSKFEVTRIFTTYITAFLMVLPLCWCCVSQAAPVRPALEEICPACKSAASQHEVPPTHSPGKECACCTGVLERAPAPEALSAPRCPFALLAAEVFWPSEEAATLRLTHAQSSRSLLSLVKISPRWHVALWLHHQALLL